MSLLWLDICLNIFLCIHHIHHIHSQHMVGMNGSLWSCILSLNIIHDQNHMYTLPYMFISIHLHVCFYNNIISIATIPLQKNEIELDLPVFSMPNITNYSNYNQWKVSKWFHLRAFSEDQMTNIGSFKLPVCLKWKCMILYTMKVSQCKISCDIVSGVLLGFVHKSTFNT